MEFIISNGVPWGERSLLLKSEESLFYKKRSSILFVVELLSSIVGTEARREEGQQCQL
jgi:hypothetical protein